MTTRTCRLPIKTVSETQLSRAIQSALEGIGCLVVRVQAGDLRGAGGHHVQGAISGTPDLWVAGQGWQGWLEVKTPDGVTSSHQEAWHGVARGRGVKVEVVRSVKQALAVVLGKQPTIPKNWKGVPGWSHDEFTKSRGGK
jgi:hypothetical protein